VSWPATSIRRIVPMSSASLRRSPPSPALRRGLADVGVITLTGGGSYITARTITALLDNTRRPVWISAFVLRTVDYDDVIRVLAQRGLYTTTDTARTYPQRLFTSERERRYAIQAVCAQGHDPAGREDTGRFHCTRYDSRPATEIQAASPSPPAPVRS
ncbi:hypothetical protein AB0N17_43885, partial [Streptomyces sp. NPDC051133]